MKEVSEGEGLKRRRARLRVVQALYMWSIVGKEDMGLLRNWQESWFKEGDEIEEGEEAGLAFEKMEFDEALFYAIMEGVRGSGNEGVRSFLERNVGSGGRDYGGVSLLLRSIVRAGMYELGGVVNEDEVRIVVADYVAVGGAFFGKGEVSLLNGLLSKVLKDGLDGQ